MGTGVGVGMGAGRSTSSSDVGSVGLREPSKRFRNPDAVLSCGLFLTGERVCAGEDLPPPGKRAVHQRAGNRYGGAGRGAAAWPELGVGGGPVQGRELPQAGREL